jgi:hypothetical protein
MLPIERSWAEREAESFGLVANFAVFPIWELLLTFPTAYICIFFSSPLPREPFELLLGVFFFVICWEGYVKLIKIIVGGLLKIVRLVISTGIRGLLSLNSQ